MKNLFSIFFLSFNLFCFSQNEPLNDQEIIEIFKHIRESDGSNLENPKLREQIFYHNFDTIIWLINKQGFPSLSSALHKQKVIDEINRATILTFIHVLQTDPKLLLNPKTIKLIEQEVKSNRINPFDLKIALSVFQYEKDFHLEGVPVYSESTIDCFYLAIRKWNIKIYPEK